MAEAHNSSTTYGEVSWAIYIGCVQNHPLYLGLYSELSWKGKNAFGHSIFSVPGTHHCQSNRMYNNNGGQWEIPLYILKVYFFTLLQGKSILNDYTARIYFCMKGVCQAAPAAPSSLVSLAASAMHDGISDVLWETISALHRVGKMSLKIRTALQNGQLNLVDYRVINEWFWTQPLWSKFTFYILCPGCQ